MLDSVNVGSLLNTFVGELGRETRLLQQLVALRTRTDDVETRESMAPLFAVVDSALARLEDAVGTLRTYHANHSCETATRAKRVKQHHENIAERISAIQEHLPLKLVQTLAQNLKEEGEAKSAGNQAQKRGGEVVPSQSPQEQCTQLNEAELLPVKWPNRDEQNFGNGGSVDTRSANHFSKNMQRRKGPESTKETCHNFPEAELPNAIQGISKDELESIPQYLKGRLTVERIDATISMLNKVMHAKYIFLSRSLRTLNSQETNRWHDMKSIETECPELEGRPFFTDVDIRTEGYSMDSTMKSVLNVLRHVSLLKEVRGKNKIRIFIIVE